MNIQNMTPAQIATFLIENDLDEVVVTEIENANPSIFVLNDPLSELERVA
jgi:hypothetical protein